MPISDKQMRILAFQYTGYDAIICDGAVRSGKTALMAVAFVDWAMRAFDGQTFAICGKTIESARKNVIVPYMSMTYWRRMGYGVKWHGQEKVMVVRRGGRCNRFEVFGGRDESSYMLIQGRTLAGVLLDEVALMPKSFVLQALARCSVEGSRFWFNCNPDSPTHWFKTEWIDRAEEHNALHLHFLMTDNPSLSEKVLARYDSMYTGVFRRRYIDGEWVKAEGLVWPSWERAMEAPPDLAALRPREWCVSLDYGTQNAFAALLWCRDAEGTWHAVSEYYWSGRDQGHQRTNADYAADLRAMVRAVPGTPREVDVYVDPSATAFKAELRRAGGWRVRNARNDVLDGLQETDVAITEGAVRISEACESLRAELGGYVWDDGGGDRERPVKVDDHACDALRYFVASKRVTATLESTPYKSVFG